MLSENVTGIRPSVGLRNEGDYPGVQEAGGVLSNDSYKARPQRDGSFKVQVPGAQAVLGGDEAPRCWGARQGQESRESPQIPEWTENCPIRACPK